MRHLLLGACLGAASIATLAPANAGVPGVARIPSIAAQHATDAAIAQAPNLAGVHDFTVLPRSKAPADLATLTAYFSSFGFTVAQRPHTHDLALRGTYAQAQRAIGTTLQTVREPGETIVRTAGPLAFPARVGALIAGTSFVPGAHARPLSVRPNAALHGPLEGYGPGDLAKLYDMTPVYAAGDFGHGVNIAIAACSTVNPSDITAYGQRYGLPPAKVHYVPVDGTTTSEDGEATLDTERIYGTAPAADIYVYLAPNCFFSELTDMFAKIAEDTETLHFAAVSHSYGFPEADFAFFGVTQSLIDQSTAIAGIKLENVPVFASSGDGGAWGDLAENETDVSFPASDSNVVAVGGTTVETNANGGRLFEYAWSGSGGGFSQYFPIPSYQNIPGMASYVYKNLPDVAIVGDPNTGVAEYWANNVYGAPPLFAIGGTSVSAPTVAGIVALIDHHLASQHRPYLHNAAAAFYGRRSGAFFDVVNGTNGYFATKVGYDNVTGIGVPDVAKLVNSL